MNGVLAVDKPEGVTSHDVVAAARRALRSKSIGHTGTLDPMATGLLILCVGKATRLQNFLMGMEKTYEGTIQFGWATDTYDAEGEPASEAVPADVTIVQLLPHLPKFLGEIEQVPPAFSAKKIDGVRAYEMARKGEEVKLPAKKVTIHEFIITEIDGSTAQFRVRSSSGTYIRSLAHDLGTAIGVPAHLKALRRTAIGDFKVEDSLTFEKLESADLNQIVAKPHFLGLGDIDLPLEKVRLDWTQQARMIGGQSVILNPGLVLQTGDLLALGSPNDQLVAIGEVVNVLREGGPCEVKPKVVLAG